MLACFTLVSSISHVMFLYHTHGRNLVGIFSRSVAVQRPPNWGKYA